MSEHQLKQTNTTKEWAIIIVLAIAGYIGYLIYQSRYTNQGKQERCINLAIKAGTAQIQSGESASMDAQALKTQSQNIAACKALYPTN